PTSTDFWPSAIAVESRSSTREFGLPGRLLLWSRPLDGAVRLTGRANLAGSGTKRENAIALIKGAVEKLELEWDRLVAETPRYVQEMKDDLAYLVYLDEMDALAASYRDNPPEGDVVTGAPSS